jgi:predicted nucleic acid-binding protein
MLAEVANIVWKKCALLDELTEVQAREIVDAVRDLPLGYYYTSGLLVEAVQIALSTKRSVYDSLYLALAVKEQGQLMTDDLKLHESLQSTSLARFVTLIENY